MDISLDWLSDFVDLSGISVEAIAHKLTMATAETESIKRVRRSIEGVLVGEVIATTPKGDKVWATVECGNRRFHTICTAPNVYRGVKAPFAPAGVRLANGKFVEVRDESEGVLCSAAEIGLSDWHEELFRFPAEVHSGTALLDLMPVEDILIEIDNKSLTHRPDLWGQYGFARELAALFDRPLRQLDLDDLSKYKGLPLVDIVVDKALDCPVYTAVRFKSDASRVSPVIIQRRLHALGMRTRNLLVDLTNYTMLELGQPTHVYDGQTIPSIRVAPMGTNGPFKALDGHTHEMITEDLMIWSGSQPAAIAGVIGGEDTAIQETTTEVLLESANFVGSRVRRTALRLNTRTEASQRFEKNQPPAITKTATSRILALLVKHGGLAAVVSQFTVQGNLGEAFRYINVPHAFLKEKAGVNIPSSKVMSILTALGFTVQLDCNGVLECGIPPHRSMRDVSLPEDIVEEVLRVFGYDNIAPILPVRPLAPVPLNPYIELEHNARRVLTVGHSFTEVHTDGWYDSSWLNIIHYQPQNPLCIQNLGADENAVLRTHLLPNLLKLVSRNCAHRESFRLMEIGAVFSADSKDKSIEETQLAGVLYQAGPITNVSTIQVAMAKSAIDDLGRMIRRGIRFTKDVKLDNPWESRDLTAEIVTAEGECIGKFGILSSAIREQLCPHGGVVWFCLSLEALRLSVGLEDRYAAIPEYPASYHDFSILWEIQKGYEQLISMLNAFAHPLVYERKYLSHYSGTGLPGGVASYTFRYQLQLEDRTLTTGDIDGFRQCFMQFLSQYDLHLR